MKKFLLSFLLVFMIFLSGCDNNDKTIVSELKGEYYFVECIYLSPFSSSTLDFYPSLDGSLIYIEFFDDQIIYHENDDETTTYNQIEFREEDVYKDLDDLITLDFDGVFELFDYRYDIYSEDVSAGLTIFISEETIYLAQTRMIGGSHDIFTVWSIVEIEKQID